jgi:plasmid stability protein
MGRIAVDLSPELEQQLREDAAREGYDVEAFVRRTLEERLASSGRPTPALAAAGLQQRSPEELLALARDQGVGPVTRFEDLLGDFWPEEESVDLFLEARKRWQWEGQEGSAKRRRRKGANG